jgi:hypothetical protein
MAVQNLQGLGGEKGLVLFNQIWISLLVFIWTLETILVFFSVTSEKGKDWVCLSIHNFAFEFFAKLGDDRDMMGFYFSPPRLIQRNVEFWNASGNSA